MNDRRVSDLVRMAVEVDELERGAGVGSPRLRLVGADAEPAHPLPTRGWWVGMTLAAAAVLAMAAMLPFMLRPTEQPTGPIAMDHSGAGEMRPIPTYLVSEGPTRPGLSESPVDAGSVEKCVVVAIYRDRTGGVNCVTPPTPQVWQGNKCLSEVSAQELKTVTLDRPCAKEADHALVVAMAGPQRSLPKTESDAVGIATCILGGPNGDGGEGLGRIATAAASCVPPEVAVKIEAIGGK
jgi:hypothetical protein